MSNTTEELIRICESLPEDKRNALAEFARFLAAQQDDERWERLIAHPEPRPKLDAFLREAATEGATLLNPDQL